MITIFPCCLFKLSVKHQYHFYSHLLDNQDDHVPDISYYKNIMGEFSEGISIFIAFFEEMNLIDQMFEIICGKKLFKKLFKFDDKNRPEYFHPFLIPTNTMYCNFCRTLYKIFADQLNKKGIKAFAKKIHMTIPDFDKLGTLTALQQLFNLSFKAFDGSDMGSKIVNIWKKEIHEHRNKSSHALIDDVYDIKIFYKYRDTINEAYKSVRLIRLVLSSFPQIKTLIDNNEIEMSEDLYNGNIHIYFSPLKMTDIN